MAGSTFTANIGIIKQAQLTKMAKRYEEYSRDYDNRAAAKEYDAQVKKLAAAAHSVAWAEKVLEFIQKPLSAEVAQYATELETGKGLKVAAQTVLSDKAKSDENERIRLAEEWDKNIMLLLSKPHTLDWCKNVEKTYSEFCALEKRVKSLSRQGDALEATYKEIGNIRKAIAFDKSVTDVYGGKKDGEVFWKNADKIQKDYDELGVSAQKYCTETTKLKEMVALAERQRKAIADELDGEYQRVKTLTHSMDSVKRGRAYISKWESSPQSAKKFCKYATAQAIQTLTGYCNWEAEKLNQEQADASAAEKWDNEIINVCGYALSKGTLADRKVSYKSDAHAEIKMNCYTSSKGGLAYIGIFNEDEERKEEYRLKVDKLKADFDKVPARIKALCKCKDDLERAVKDAYRARREIAASLDAEFKRVKVSPSTRALISDGRNLIRRWDFVPKTVKALCLLLSDKEITNLAKFYTAEEKRLDEEDKARARRLAEEKERERKRKEAEEKARQKRELDNSINDSYARAKKGDAEAMYKLAGYYFTGTGVTRSYADAFDWYEKAAKKGHVGAMEKLGDCYYYGYGVEKSYSKAEKWYKKASK